MPPITPHERLRAFGNQLIEIHLHLREKLARLREEAGYPTPGRLRDLRAHCLSFCSAVHRHHTGEDGGAFRVLAEQVPQLAPVLEELAWDHQQVEAILRRVTELAASDAPPATVRGELDGLAAVLESHFAYEEKKLVAALNALDPAGARTEDLLGVPLPTDAPD